MSHIIASASRETLPFRIDAATRRVSINPRDPAFFQDPHPVYEAIRATGAGLFVPGRRVFGLAEQGVGYATSNPALTSDIVAALEVYRREIISGAIVVPTEP